MSAYHTIHVPAKGSKYTLVLFHGTGGDETSLLEIGKAVAPEASLLGVRGNSNEEGSNRYFRRFEEGVFDEDDLRTKAAEISDALKELSDGNPRVALGFSNGANIATAILSLHPEALSGVIAIRGQSPLKHPPETPLDGKAVLLLNGERDPLVPLEDARKLAENLRQRGAEVQHEIVPAGHQLTMADITAAGNWLAAHQWG
ncbi:MAG: alpha/beta hydrolase [Armatimonadetes bacterium]|nr:alpha/beta hydrolase [Armatimonadota bacterium]